MAHFTVPGLHGQEKDQSLFFFLEYYRILHNPSTQILMYDNGAFKIIEVHTAWVLPNILYLLIWFRRKGIMDLKSLHKNVLPQVLSLIRHTH